MQVYRGMPILTAAPTAEDYARVPHRLYEYRDPAAAFSAADWAEDAAAAIRACWAEGRLPIVVGGTGMYLKALMQGFSPIPDIPPEVREQVRNRETAEIRERLAEADPALHARLKAGDSQRIARAYEVFLATGKPLSHWQDLPPIAPLPEAHFHLYGLTLPRTLLYSRCDARLVAMLEKGALEELASLLARNLPESLPAMRAVGLPELAAHLHNEATLDEALRRAQQATRHYAKRQMTWLRNQFPDAIPVEYPYDSLATGWPELA